jgi:flavorubredoxin
MKPVLVKDDIYWLGVHDPGLDSFEVVLPTPWGTTYNSYLIMADKPALIETVKVTFRDEYLEKIKSLVDPLNIAYLILDHTEADHSGAVPWVAEIAPNARVITSEAASRHIYQLFHLEREPLAVGDGDKLDLGDRELSFIGAPNLHWPDTMFTYSPADRALFTCDAFGVHYCNEGAVFDDEAGDFAEAYRYYFDKIMRPFKEKVRDAIGKIADLELDVICPGHGPVLRSDPRKYLNLYLDWVEEEGEAPAQSRVAVLYSSAYGNVAQMADQIARGLAAAGADPVLRDALSLREDDVPALLDGAAALLVGVPAFAGDALAPIERVLAAASAANVGGKPAAVFGPFGTTGEGVRRVEDELAKAGAKITAAALAVDFAPDEEVFQRCRAFGLEFAEALKRD